jgi:cysteinyl-tRNA synthetase
MPNALAELWDFIRDKKAKGKYQTIKKMDEVFGLDLLKKEKIEISKKVKELIKKREKARKEKNWEKADEIREKIKKLGYYLDDTKKGVVVKKDG